jgi:hypothetical protein
MTVNHHRQRAAQKRAAAEGHRAVAPVLSLRSHRDWLLAQAELLDLQAEVLDREADELEAGRQFHRN